jgi:hypothetical protein
MEDKRDRRLVISALDDKHIILDVGLVHTKCGFNKDPVPMHVAPTPFRLVQALRDNITDVSLRLPDWTGLD